MVVVVASMVVIAAAVVVAVAMVVVAAAVMVAVAMIVIVVAAAVVIAVTMIVIVIAMVVIILTVIVVVAMIIVAVIIVTRMHCYAAAIARVIETAVVSGILKAGCGKGESGNDKGSCYENQKALFHDHTPENLFAYFRRFSLKQGTCQLLNLSC